MHIFYHMYIGWIIIIKISFISQQNYSILLNKLGSVKKGNFLVLSFYDYRISLNKVRRKFNIFRWGQYLKNFKFYVLNVSPILWKRGDIIQGRTLFKEIRYLLIFQQQNLEKFHEEKQLLVSIINIFIFKVETLYFL